MRQHFKSILRRLPIPLSRNHRYDIQTKKIIRTETTPRSNCIDIGVLDGEILDLFLKYAPQGTHYGFEPLPEKFSRLEDRYSGENVVLFNCALSDKNGQSSFNYVDSNPSYSGLLKRRYDREGESDQLIMVDMRALDTFIDKIKPVKIIKIDVEGAEYAVLQGGKRLLHRDMPLIIFEFGMGAADIYGTTPQMMFDLLSRIGYEIFLLDKWLQSGPALSAAEFEVQFTAKRNYYFIAAPGREGQGEASSSEA